MHPINQILAGWLSLALWHIPQPDYFGMWMEQSMRLDALPPITGF